MKSLGLNEIRESFLRYFESKEHLRLKSFSLVPQNDKSLLVINSGMAPMKPFFTGKQVPPSKRVTTCQKCLRTNDIENVGMTSRHGTFFEMLGNFSFGDYFKEEIIPWAWEFLTKIMEIPEERLFPSVYLEDDEAYDIWHKKAGIPKDKIFRLGKEDNFWEVGLGPCGPSSEIYYDRGAEKGCGKPDCTVGCECDRFIEIWNLVFTQFSKEEDGSYAKLKNPNIDTGMGLERISMVMQGVDSLFEIDTIKSILDDVCRISGKKYNENPKDDLSIRIITDHLRSVTFMTADGILASNEGLGYVLRRLLRRAARHGKLLGIKHMFLAEIVKTVINQSKDAYPELLEKKDYIYKLISVEEQRFYETLDSGIEILKGFIKEMKSTGKALLGGESAFKLYDTFGFPLELMDEILADEGFSVDTDAFKQKMQEQRERGRSAREASDYMGAADTIYNKLDKNINSTFVGYNNLSGEARILALISNGQISETASAGDDVSVIIDNSVLYPEGGGQSGDSGVIETETGKIIINDCIKVMSNKIAAIGKLEYGSVNVSQKANVKVDASKRIQTARNHSATHLLQKALRIVLGNHVEQSGSFVTSERLRFDFTHFCAVSSEEILKIEQLVNEMILNALDVEIIETTPEDAAKRGALALFGEKYSSVVRMVSMGEFSVELCGGTHVKNTAQIGPFKILSESGIAAGVRRIEAVTGTNALAFYRTTEETLKSLQAILKATPENTLKKAEALSNTAKELSKEVERLNAKLSSGDADNLINGKIDISGVSVVKAVLKNTDVAGIRTMSDQIKDKLKSCVIILAGEKEDKANLLVTVTEDLTEKGLNAGMIIKEAAQAIGGKGGGKPTMAQAGINDVSKIPEAMDTAVKAITAAIR